MPHSVGLHMTSKLKRCKPNRDVPLHGDRISLGGSVLRSHVSRCVCMCSGRSHYDHKATNVTHGRAAAPSSRPPNWANHCAAAAAAAVAVHGATLSSPLPPASPQQHQSSVAGAAAAIAAWAQHLFGEAAPDKSLHLTDREHPMTLL